MNVAESSQASSDKGNWDELRPFQSLLAEAQGGAAPRLTFVGRAPADHPALLRCSPQPGLGHCVQGSSFPLGQGPKGRALSPSLPDSAPPFSSLIFSSLLLPPQLGAGARSFLEVTWPSPPLVLHPLALTTFPKSIYILEKTNKNTKQNNVLPGTTFQPPVTFMTASAGVGPCPRAVDSRARGLAPSDPRPPQPEGRGARDPRSEAGQKRAGLPATRQQRAARTLQPRRPVERGGSCRDIWADP